MIVGLVLNGRLLPLDFGLAPLVEFFKVSLTAFSTLPRVHGYLVNLCILFYMVLKAIRVSFSVVSRVSSRLPYITCRHFLARILKRG